MLSSLIYTEDFYDYEKWRICYNGGRQFKTRYLYKFSDRESDADYQARVNMSYCPRFAGQILDEIRDSITNRFGDIIRKSNSLSYENCVVGERGGVDLHSSSMNYFVGNNLVLELLLMSRVGVYVDMPANVGYSLADSRNARPYLYYYRFEDIISYEVDDHNNPIEVCLRDVKQEKPKAFGLEHLYVTRYRHYVKEPDGVYCTFYDEHNKQVADTIKLGIDEIPFHLLKVSHSLMKDIADYQIALANAASSDMAYITRANYPFYVEMYDPQAEMAREMMRRSEDGTAAGAETSKPEDMEVGPTKGRRVHKGTELPKFIHPSSEPIKASMEKQEQLKAEMRQLLNLSVSRLKATRSSAESKEVDNSKEENGLAFIARELELAENNIVKFWEMYERVAQDGRYGRVIYPTSWDLKTTEQKTKESDELIKLTKQVPSITYKKECLKRVAHLTIGDKLSKTSLDKIYAEIDKAKSVVSDPEEISKDVEDGLLSRELASQMKGYPDDQIEIANKEHADRAARIAIAQSLKGGAGKAGDVNSDADDNPAARGVPDLSSKSSKQEVTEERENGTLRDR